MNIVCILGGLGNQMFQYAFAYALSKKTNSKVLVDISRFDGYGLHHGYELDKVFGIEKGVASPDDLDKVIGFRRRKYINKFMLHKKLSFLSRGCVFHERGFRFDSDSLLGKSGFYFIGYWQSEKYFLDCKDEIRNAFRFLPEMSGQNNDVANMISECNSISLHVRRGDYISNNKNKKIFNVCGVDYYNRAVEIMADKVEKPFFFIFSNDMQWVKENLKLPYDHIAICHNHGDSSYEDMRLMSLCKHHIIANSSFSWWGAWLGKNINKCVVAPEKWFVCDYLDASDLIPDSWHKI